MPPIRPRRNSAAWPAVQWASWGSSAPSLLYRYLVGRGIITLEQLIGLMAVNPRRIFGLGGGTEEGDAADFTVFDLEAEYRIDPATFRSKGRATPFAGWPVRGRAVLTVVGGREVYDYDNCKFK